MGSIQVESWSHGVELSAVESTVDSLVESIQVESSRGVGWSRVKWSQVDSRF